MVLSLTNMLHPHANHKYIIQLPYLSGLRVILKSVQLIGFVLHNLAFHLSQPLPPQHNQRLGLETPADPCRLVLFNKGPQECCTYIRMPRASLCSASASKTRKGLMAALKKITTIDALYELQSCFMLLLAFVKK